MSVEDAPVKPVSVVPKRASRQWPHHPPMAVVSALIGAMLIAGIEISAIALLVAVGVVQLVLVITAVWGTAIPGRRGVALIAASAAAGADAAVMKWHLSGYSPVVAVLGLAVVLMFCHQLARGSSRARVTESLAVSTVVLVAVVSLTGLIVLRYQDQGVVLSLAVVGAIAAALFVGYLIDAVLPVPRFDPSADRGMLALVMAIVGGAAIALWQLRRADMYTDLRAAAAGAVLAAVACLLSVGASFAGAHSTLSTGSRSAAGKRRLRGVAAVLMVYSLATPAGYALVNALSR